MKTIIKTLCLVTLFVTALSCSKDDDTSSTEQNNAPTITAQTFTVAENIADNLVIGQVEANDEDGDELSYSINTNDNNLFEINEEGVLSLDDLQTLDFETAQSHTITIAVSDGNASAEAEIVIIVIDIDDTSFVTRWVTQFNNETIAITTRADEYTYNYTIDWGDGTVQSGRTGDVAHDYETAGNYMTSIRGDFPAIHLFPNDEGREQIRSVEQWGTTEWQTMEEAFIAAEQLDINATDTPDLSQVESLRAMFAFVGEFTVNNNINNWDVSNITDMRALFSISSFNGNVNNWDVSNVTDMASMFSSTPFNGDISNWDMNNVVDMSSMFTDTQFNGDISNWNVSSVTNMSSLFRDSIFNQDISNWDVSNVTEMNFMFEGASFNQDISNWNVANVAAMVRMFEGSVFNQNINTWDVSNVIGMGSMFRNSSFNQDISDWEVVNVVNMIKMFQDSSFNQDISDWNVTNVTDCNDFSLNAPLTPENTPNFTNCTP